MEDKKNPIVTVKLGFDWEEFKKIRPSSGFIIALVVIFIVLVFTSIGRSYYDGVVNRLNGEIELREKEREKAEALQELAENAYAKVVDESEAAEEEALKEIVRLGRRVTTLNRAVTSLTVEKVELQEELALAPEEIVSIPDEELAALVPPRIAEAYPQFGDSTFIYNRTTGFFTGNRPFANAVSLSLIETSNLRLQLSTSEEIVSLNNRQITSLNGIIAEQDIRIGGWTGRATAAEIMAETRLGTIEALTGEKDAWEDKSTAQGRQLFLYKWGMRAGVAGAVVVGILVARQ